jgi:hypothetical protein
LPTKAKFQVWRNEPSHNQHTTFPERNLINASIFPNPSTNSATLTYKLAANTKGRLLLLNTLRTLVGSYKLDNMQTEFIFSTSVLQNGIYYYSIYSNMEVVGRGKLIVVR